MVALVKNSDRPNQPATDARFNRRTPRSNRFENQNLSQRYKRARIYSAQLGRFISRDPLGFVDGMSLYRAYFVPGGMDPDGTDSLTPRACTAVDIQLCEKECARTNEVAVKCTCYTRVRIRKVGLTKTIKVTDKIAAPECEKYKGDCGKCTQQEHAWLRAQKEAACLGAGKPRPGQSCDRLAFLYFANLACAIARDRVARKCFDDNDPVHVAEVKKHKDWASDASSFYIKKPCPPRPGLGVPQIGGPFLG